MTALIKLKQIEPIPPSIVIPAPHIVLARLRDPILSALNPAGVDHTWLADGSEKLVMYRTPLVTVMDVSDYLLTLHPRLELLWFRRERRNNGGGSNGYRHPSHFPTANTNVDSPTNAAPISTPIVGSRFRGGQPTNKAGCVSEWNITKIGQRFFIDSLGQHMKRASINYVDTTGSVSTVSLICPSYLAASSQNANQHGTGYGAKYRPNYFQFRISVDDPADPRNRLIGPASKTIACAHNVHPFVHDAAISAVTGLVCNNIHSQFKDNEMNCWFANRMPN